MDAIRCDEKDYLIWKWRPKGCQLGESPRENSIRWGSPLVVLPGQAAVFCYEGNGGYDIIRGNTNIILKPENLPVLASIIGLAYNGDTPFPASVFFINLTKTMEISVTTQFDRVIPAEPEFQAYDIRVAMTAGVTVEIPSQTDDDIKAFIERVGMQDRSLSSFAEEARQFLVSKMRAALCSAPQQAKIFVLHMNSLLEPLGTFIQSKVMDQAYDRFGVLLRYVNITSIRFDEEGEGYQMLKTVTADRAFKFEQEQEANALLQFAMQRESMKTDNEARNETVRRTASIQLDNAEDTMRRMREEGQFAQHLQSQEAQRQAMLGTQSSNMAAHSLNQQAEVLKAGMENLGQMGSVDMGGGNGGSMNPAGMMTGMMMGAAVGNQVGNMMGMMGQAANASMAGAGIPGTTAPGAPQAGATPPPMPGAVPPPMPGAQPALAVYVGVNGTQAGPFNVAELQQLVGNGQLTPQTLVWMQGMAAWAEAGTLPQLAPLFAAPAGGAPVPPPLP